jgi:hypothetical protein
MLPDELLHAPPPILLQLLLVSELSLAHLTSPRQSVSGVGGVQGGAQALSRRKVPLGLALP